MSIRSDSPDPRDESPDDTGRAHGSASGPATVVLARLASLYPPAVDPGDRLERSLTFLGAGIDAETVVKAGYGGAMLALLVATAAAALLGSSAPLGAVVGLAVALGTAHAVHVFPVVAARLRRTRALGAAPDLVGRAVLRMRVAPTAESAASFAATEADGPLADNLAEHVRRARGTGASGFGSFAAEWADWFPALRRAVLLVDAAADAPADERTRSLDRALDAVLDGTRDRMSSFASDVRGPATALYAFGVLLPMALVAVVPAAGVAGLPVSLTAVVVVYDVLLPVTLIAAGVWLLGRRPVAFRPPSVSRSHPSIPDRRASTVAAALVAGTLGWVVAAALVGWGGPFGAAGAASGSGLLLWFRPETQVRDRALAVEDGLADALYLIGRRVDEGTAVEAAVERAAEEVSGETGAVLADAARRQRQLRVGVREAFLGKHGPLVDLPSPRARSSIAVLGLAAREGRPAGSAAVALAEHLEALRSAEREARASLARVTDTLGTTGAVFAPLVGGSTVALSGGMAGVRGAEPLPTAGLGLAVGAYVLLLAVLLTTLAVGLDRGLDRTSVGYRCGRALLSATAIYLAAAATAGLLV